jgi:ribosomal protein S27E
MEMIPEEWYFAVDCKNCNAKIAIIHDPSKGKIELDGDPVEVRFSIACASCGKTFVYPLMDIHHFQARPKPP